MFLIEVDNKIYKKKKINLKNLTIYQLCTELNITLPCYCYHNYLSIAGNCRMCIIELKGIPKLQIACMVVLISGMKILTKTLRVQKARKSVLEFLLINHPLDCPICDQGGECDLQDMYQVFGSTHGRFFGTYKRVVMDRKDYM